jgi:hypothetical protein
MTEILRLTAADFDDDGSYKKGKLQYDGNVTIPPDLGTVIFDGIQIEGELKSESGVVSRNAIEVNGGNLICDGEVVANGGSIVVRGTLSGDYIESYESILIAGDIVATLCIVASLDICAGGKIKCTGGDICAGGTIKCEGAIYCPEDIRAKALLCCNISSCGSIEIGRRAITTNAVGSPGK